MFASVPQRPRIAFALKRRCYAKRLCGRYMPMTKTGELTDGVLMKASLKKCRYMLLRGMGRLASIIMLVHCGFLHAARPTLEEGFKSPPMDARPQTWWHWMNGNVTKAGIKADLEAMKEIGLGGASLFDAGCNIPPGPLKFNSPEWFDTVRFAAAEARRLGLSICLPNCSGWSSSGGPWIRPEDGMKALDHTEIVVEGPCRIEQKLPAIPDPHGFAADIAVLAVPVPSAELDTMEKAGVKITATDRLVRTLSFPEPFAASGAFYRLKHGRLWQVEGSVTVETSDDGENFTELCKADANAARRSDEDQTERYLPFPRTVKARHWRMSFRFWDWESHVDLGGRIDIASVSVGRRASISALCDKTLRKRMDVTRDPEAAADQVVPKADVRDVTRFFGADGILRWDAPAGMWRIIRLGYALNGRRNHPASATGEGFEVDKLSAKALDFHFEQYAARLVRHLGNLAGNGDSGLNGILVDSYEVGCQNWTKGFEEEFAKRRGYDMTPYMPVLAGVVVGGVDESERFLYDFRRTVADLFAEGYSGALAEKCRQYGLKLSLEPYGNCPCDDLEYGENADIPQSEFWSWVGRQGDRGVDCGNAKMPSYIAHVWGKRYCGAEAFTSHPSIGGRWRTTPFSIKAQGDRAFTRGVNRLIFHRFAHQPWTNPAYLPGMTMGLWGMHLDRTQTWWKQGRQWIEYLARCQWMLQEGTFAADVLFWHGEDVPSRGGHLVGFPQDFTDHPVPDGYDKDVCSTRALLKLRVEDGKIVAPGGVRYSLLVLQDVEEMRPEVIAAMDRIVSSGGKVAAVRKPTRMPGLRDYPNGDAKVVRLADAAWAKGVVEGAAAEGLKSIALPPDFVCLKAPEGLEKETAWIHRVYPDGVDAYFVACPNEKTGVFTCSFRIDGREPEIWDAEKATTGLAPLSWRRKEGRTEVAFELPPSGSAFVVFRRPTDATCGGNGARRIVVKEMEVKGPWELSFPVDWYVGGTAVKSVTLDKLADWCTLDDDDFRYFSGTATYVCRIDCLPASLQPGQDVVLDLGEVKHFAEVYADGRKVATLWRPPYSVDIAPFLEKTAKTHVLSVKVTNLWPNRLIGDDRLHADDCEWSGSANNSSGQGISRIPDWVQNGRRSPTGRVTFTTWRHWRKGDNLLPSGLLGPVRIEIARHTDDRQEVQRGKTQ